MKSEFIKYKALGGIKMLSDLSPISPSMISFPSSPDVFLSHL